MFRVSPLSVHNSASYTHTTQRKSTQSIYASQKSVFYLACCAEIKPNVGWPVAYLIWKLRSLLTIYTWRFGRIRYIEKWKWANFTDDAKADIVKSKKYKTTLRLYIFWRRGKLLYKLADGAAVLLNKISPRIIWRSRRRRRTYNKYAIVGKAKVLGRIAKKSNTTDKIQWRSQKSEWRTGPIGTSFVTYKYRLIN